MSADLAGTVLARTGEGMKSGPIGLAVILLLCIACYFLFKSMSGHLRKVRDEFPADPPQPPAKPSATPTSTPRAQPITRTDASSIEAPPEPDAPPDRS